MGIKQNNLKQLCKNSDFFLFQMITLDSMIFTLFDLNTGTILTNLIVTH